MPTYTAGADSKAAYGALPLLGLSSRAQIVSGGSLVLRMAFTRRTRDASIAAATSNFFFGWSDVQDNRLLSTQSAALTRNASVAEAMALTDTPTADPNATEANNLTDSATALIKTRYPVYSPRSGNYNFQQAEAPGNLRASMTMRSRTTNLDYIMRQWFFGPLFAQDVNRSEAMALTDTGDATITPGTTTANPGTKPYYATDRGLILNARRRAPQRQQAPEPVVAVVVEKKQPKPKKYVVKSLADLPTIAYPTAVFTFGEAEMGGSAKAGVITRPEAVGVVLVAGIASATPPSVAHAVSDSTPDAIWGAFDPNDDEEAINLAYQLL